MRINKQSPPLFLSCYLINLFLFLNSSNLSPTPSRVVPRNIFLHFRDKNHSLLIHSSSFVSISHNKEITHPRVTSPPTSIKLRSNLPAIENKRMTLSSENGPESIDHSQSA